MLAPFGIGNPKPVFLLARTKVTHVKRFGKEQNHFECTIASDIGGATARAYDFFRSPEDFTCVPAVNSAASLLATIERDTYRGGLALRLVDILPA
jgi:single-stranded DNA-specific DHH superfamily exonuclease